MPRRKPIPETLTPTDTEAFRRRVISSIGLWVGILSWLSLAVRNFIAPIRFGSIIGVIICGALMLSLPIILKRKVSTRLAGVVLLLALSAVGVIAGFYNGGMRAPATLVFVLTPIIGFFCIGQLGAIIALVLSAASMGLLLIAEAASWVSPLDHPEKFSYYMAFICFVGGVISYFVGAAYERSRKISDELISTLSKNAAYSAKMASLGEISAGIAHEINNPLAIIDGNIHLLLKSTTDPGTVAKKLEAI